MSMDTHAIDRQLTEQEALAVTLLAHCEITKNILLDWTNPKDKTTLARYMALKQLNNAIEAVNVTYQGYLPDNFRNRAEKFYKAIEADINYLMKGYGNHSK